MPNTLAEFLQEPTTVAQEAIELCIQNCPECAEYLFGAYERMPDSPYLYAYCCANHAPYVRAVIEPEYLIGLKRITQRLDERIKIAQDALALYGRIQKGNELLESPDISDIDRVRYERKIEQLEREMKQLYDGKMSEIGLYVKKLIDDRNFNQNRTRLCETFEVI